ncbi:ABC transporter ATP-binding protein [Methanocella sp. CWC-04]|uniref:ABC transporter ATP-binding protein n=2 Tax=Methanooceanicella nereidis TaxID=2052831 RepID=A0AAP2RC32_9EURY|nr:ABC transporter ATP-binding protein [Methanocella sp. CWC-04]
MQPVFICLCYDRIRMADIMSENDLNAGSLLLNKDNFNVIEIRYLTKNYGKFSAVCNMSLSVKQGEIFAMLGPNGAGKTTTVEILECIKTPTAGFISILGENILYAPAGNIFMVQDANFNGIKEKIGVLPQDFSAFDLLTVYENIDYFANIYRKHESVDGLIDFLGLKDKRNVLFKNLSGGLKRRVGIAIALVNNPEIVFLDEPTTGLDPKARRDVWEAIKSLKARGKTVFLTTHYMDEAYYLADRVCIVNKGSIIAEGSPEDLINEYGGGNTLVIRECGSDAICRLVEEIPESNVVGRDVQVKLPKDGGMAIIAKAVSIINSGNFSCKELYVKKSTLEDVFLNLTGEKLTERGQ